MCRRLDAMNLLLPADERESDELFDAPGSVKQEPLESEQAKAQPVGPMDEAKEAREQDDNRREDDEEVDEEDVLVSLSHLPTAHGGPVRSHILALDKLSELDSNEAAGDDENAAWEADEGAAGEGEWRSNWQSPVGDAHDGKQRFTATAQPTTATSRRRKTAAVEPHSREDAADEGQRQEDRDPKSNDAAEMDADERKQPFRPASSRKASKERRTTGDRGERGTTVNRGGKKRRKSE